MKQPKNPVETRAKEVLQMAKELDALLKEKNKPITQNQEITDGV